MTTSRTHQAASDEPVDTADDAPTAGHARSALSRRLFPGEHEPDPRFTLANERTFLAWIRTALALIAGGIAVDAFTDLLPAGLRTLAAVLLLGLGVVVSLGAAAHWIRVQRALRRAAPLPVPLLVPLLTICAATGAVMLLILTLKVP